jgi:hypothetical protein
MSKEIVDKFWAQFTSEMKPQSYFDTYGEELWELDQKLYESIESILVPILGPWEGTDNWWHETDFHGDGIRTLIFSRYCFLPNLIPQFQSLLVGDLENFVIVCLVYEHIEQSNTPFVEARAVFNDHVISI